MKGVSEDRTMGGKQSSARPFPRGTRSLVVKKEVVLRSFPAILGCFAGVSACFGVVLGSFAGVLRGLGLAAGVLGLILLV